VVKLFYLQYETYGADMSLIEICPVHSEIWHLWFLNATTYPVTFCIRYI